jgi:hypothetical protein
MSQQFNLQEQKEIERKALLVPKLRNRGRFAFKPNGDLKKGFYQLKDGRTILLSDLDPKEDKVQQTAANSTQDNATEQQVVPAAGVGEEE